ALAQHTEATLAAQRLTHAEQIAAAFEELRGQSAVQFAEAMRMNAGALETLRMDLTAAHAQMAEQSEMRTGAALQAAAEARADNTAANEEVRFAIAEVLQAQQRHRMVLESLTRAVADAPSQQQLHEVEALVVAANQALLERSARDEQFLRDAHGANK